MSRISIFIETESGLVVARGWEGDTGGELAKRLLMGTRFLFRMMKMF